LYTAFIIETYCAWEIKGSLNANAAFLLKQIIKSREKEQREKTTTMSMARAKSRTTPCHTPLKQLQAG
jgi:hypothetical protein